MKKTFVFITLILSLVPSVFPQNDWNQIIKQYITKLNIFMEQNPKIYQKFNSTFVDRLNYNQVMKVCNDSNLQPTVFIPFSKSKYKIKLFRKLPSLDTKITKEKSSISWLYVKGDISKGNLKFFIHPYKPPNNAAEVDSPWFVCRDLKYQENHSHFPKKVFDNITPAKITSKRLIQDNLINKCATENTLFTVILKQRICKIDENNLVLLNVVSVKNKTYYNLAFRGASETGNPVFGVFLHKHRTLKQFKQLSLYSNENKLKLIPHCNHL
jgi:hypothetical protein